MGFVGWFVLLWMLLLVVPAVVVRTSNKWMKNKGASRNVNRTVTMGAAFVLTLVLIGLFGAVILRSDISFGEPKPVGTYDFNGWEMNVYADEMPLYMQDLTDTTCEDWSTSARKDETFLAANTDYRQVALTQDRSVSDLEYTVTQIKVPALYALCKNSFINSREDVIRDGELLLADHYDAIDAAPWQAQEAYRVYWSDGYLNKYLLCYEDSIVEIHFDWEPTLEQMQIVAEKLGGK